MKRILTSLSLAATEKRAVVNSFNGTMLTDFTPAQDEVFCAHLRQIAQYVCGIQLKVDSFAMTFLRQMLNRYFGHLTQANITDAFEMRSAGELGLIEHYGSFSTEFVGAVLRKYCAIRNPALRRFHQKAKQLSLPAAPPVTNQRIYEMLVNWVKQHNKIPKLWMWDTVHQHLVDTGKLLPLAKQTDAQKELAVVEYLQRELRVNS